MSNTYLHKENNFDIGYDRNLRNQLQEKILEKELQNILSEL